MGLFECTFKTFAVDVVVALKGDVADTYAVVLDNVEGYVYTLCNHCILLNRCCNLAVAEALVGKVLFDEFAVLVENIVRELVTALELEL